MDPNSPPANPNEPPAKPPANAAPADPWGADIDPELKAFIGNKSPLEVAKELKGAQALIGKKTIGIPGKDSTPEEQRAFHEARGVPKDEAGYNFTDTLAKLKENAPEGFVDQPEREAKFRTWARQSNLSNSEANALLEQYITDEFTSNRDVIKAQADATKKATDLMTEGWGADLEANRNSANLFARHMGLDQETIDVFLAVAGSNPQARFNLVNFMSQQGKMLEEGGAGEGNKNHLQPGGGQMTPQQARQAKDNFLAQGDNQAAYLDSGHKNHAAVTRQMTVYLKAERGVKT